MKKNVSPKSVSVKKPPEKKVRAKNILVKERLAKPFPIVGFGASAGGLEAFTILLKHLDPNLGMAYVLVMHLSPNHKSALSEVVQFKTKMKVHTVKDGMKVKPNNIYVIPPNTLMSIVDGALKLAPRTLDNFAVDYFLIALASVYKNNAIGVILSGTATDGTLGLKAIKAGGGITFAQDATAKFSGMPNNAYDSGYVDFMLPPEGIAHELAQLVKIPYTVLPSDKIEAAQGDINDHAEELKKILAIVKNKWGVDFFHNYKHASIYRRVIRRMALNKFEKLEDYHSMIRSNPKEVDALYDDFLINVTDFFRDPDFYNTLTSEIFPALIEQIQSPDAIRIWVAGCSTGEEAYSIAICLIEFLKTNELTTPIQIFASDLDANAIEKARLGIYAISAVRGVSPNYLKQYFVKFNGHYQIVKSVREICVFSQHNLLSDPPFSRMNLISCQNVLIYLETNPQKKILQTFHYALRPGGFLFLGKSETIGAAVDLFEPLNKKIKIYSRKSTNIPQLDFTIDKTGNGSPKKVRLLDQAGDTDIEKVISKLILSNFVHPCVVVNKNLTIIQFFGITSPYLEPVSGKASFNILKMIREDLVIDLGGLLQQARKTEKIVTREGIRIHINKIQQEITIEIVPKKASGEIFFLVVFKANIVIQSPAHDKAISAKSRSDHKDRTILKLEEELTHSRGLVRSTNEEYETTYEELQANNEEILSSNEELQSVNEELEASKEELQSAIEELTTTNDEFRKRNVELKDSQLALKKVNEQLEQFAFISSHDLQEPLRKIQTFANRLSTQEAGLNDFAKQCAGKINASAFRMSTLLNDLLKFSLLNKNKNDKPARVDLNEILKNVIEDFEVSITNKKAIINLSSLPVIDAEPVQMNQLFHNLIGNALKFSKENPVITISSRDVTPEDFRKYHELSKDKHYVSISVSDNGLGFEQKYASRIFIIFQRLHNNIGTTPGTGIGLTICKKIVEDHGGFIFAEGLVDSGATFTIFLPAD